MAPIFNPRNLVLTFALLLTTSTASAVRLNYTMTGVVDTIDHELQDYFLVGTTFSLSVLIDSTTPPFCDNGLVKQYEPQVLGTSVGDYEMIPSPFPSISVINDFLGRDEIRFDTFVTGDEFPSPPMIVVDEVYVSLEDSSATAFDSKALPL